MAGEKSFTNLGAKKADLEAARDDRLTDAEALFQAGRNASSIAAGLYALEIAIKVKICERLKLDALPRAFEIHDIEGLLLLSGLSRRTNERRARGGRFRRNWDVIDGLSRQLNDFRYLPDSGWGRDAAVLFLECLNHPRDGILPWLRRQR